MRLRLHLSDRPFTDPVELEGVKGFRIEGGLVRYEHGGKTRSHHPANVVAFRVGADGGRFSSRRHLVGRGDLRDGPLWTEPSPADSAAAPPAEPDPLCDLVGAGGRRIARGLRRADAEAERTRVMNASADLEDGPEKLRVVSASPRATAAPHPLARA